MHTFPWLWVPNFQSLIKWCRYDEQSIGRVSTLQHLWMWEWRASIASYAFSVSIESQKKFSWFRFPNTKSLILRTWKDGFFWRRKHTPFHLHNMRNAFPSCTYGVPVSLKAHDGIIIRLPLPQSHCPVHRCRENEWGIRRKTTAINLTEHHSTVIIPTALECPFNVFTHFPCAAFHTFTAPYPPETMNIPFLENSQQYTWNDWDLILWIQWFLPTHPWNHDVSYEVDKRLEWKSFSLEPQNKFSVVERSFSK